MISAYRTAVYLIAEAGSRISYSASGLDVLRTLGGQIGAFLLTMPDTTTSTFDP
jgi:hypothetical protein